MDREKQEKEVLEYLQKKLPHIDLTLICAPSVIAKLVVKTIMDRYDLFDTEDLKRE